MNATSTPASTPSAPAPQRDALNAPYWDSLARGTLSFQRCGCCGKAWLPARSECPGCLATDWRWEPASGSARLISWVVYHVAYHPAFENRLPYNVAVVELDEGPRLISNVVGIEDAENLKIDQPLRLVIEEENGIAVARFTPA
ncbi:OB-fold domain-containing protein [Glaciimonas sp. CA11.2]|uniref:Zn-ribbon domain-containing OB-fold protein n=1 Tax=unclassified Glaciimonas TaxID=2644401 RepID=UPI002AB51786|nr:MULTISPECIES: OB-fold domain-containing protein [unclassified Glaciimonas]MDY7546878.1 OB-fold domain-containing protein [Glaciimonas sp. CA11.2]MEB0012347.1 OB-fold domain-containing protein [Glaciimonas sp. Cout2]MEB0080467.1 OB-fold domain-containing protein [Glaciimonas sp. Gout2]MEB0161920.1 OB-fold domain-containing protein [Glaciimonas sp. CA11.2]